jgi:hypothetical protein
MSHPYQVKIVGRDEWTVTRAAALVIAALEREGYGLVRVEHKAPWWWFSRMAIIITWEDT